MTAPAVPIVAASGSALVAGLVSTFAFGLTTGLAVGLPLGIKNGTAHGPLAGLVAGVGFAMIIGLVCRIGASDTWRTTLLFLQLRRHAIPVRGMQFLEAARQRGVLRTVGPLYQFKHPNLQDRLAKKYEQHLRRTQKVAVSL